MSAVSRVNSAVTRGLFGLASGALLVMLLSYVIEVVLRYFFNAPTRWSSDLVSYAMLVSIAFALPAVTRDNGHVAITSLVERLRPTVRTAAFRALAWFGALSCLAGTVLLWSQGIQQFRGGIETVATLSIPKWWLSAVAGIGFAGAAAHFIDHALEAVTQALGGEREL